MCIFRYFTVPYAGQNIRLDNTNVHALMMNQFEPLDYFSSAVYFFSTFTRHITKHFLIIIK